MTPTQPQLQYSWYELLSWRVLNLRERKKRAPPHHEGRS